jgi:membrane protein DedA with SNARE-associated domain
MEELIARWGYLAVLLGSVFEGESVVLAAGFAAHRNLLDLPLVMLVAAIGSAIGDQIWFQLGRRFGPRLLARFPKLAPGVAHATALLRRYDTRFIVGCRFIYGTRLAGPIAIGLSGVAPLRFALLNIAAAAVWAIVVAGLGYGFGETIFQVFGHIHHLEHSVVPAIIIAGIVVAVGLHWRRVRRAGAGRRDAGR